MTADKVKIMRLAAAIVRERGYANGSQGIPIGQGGEYKSGPVCAIGALVIANAAPGRSAINEVYGYTPDLPGLREFAECVNPAVAKLPNNTCAAAFGFSDRLWNNPKPKEALAAAFERCADELEKKL